jgi:hypothetical protein
MAQVASATLNKPAWVDLATTDAAAARAFYSKVFGWNVEVNPDPQYGGYGIARVNGQDAAGIGGTQSPDQPAAWSVYIGSDDLEALSKAVSDAGGTVAVPAFDVGDQGRMAVFRDPSGAFISSWQATKMGGFQAQGSNAFGWAELNARGVDGVLPFYQQIFGWTAKAVGTPDRPYTEFQVEGHSIAGATEMNPMVPPEVPSYWMAYFAVDDVDASHRTAVEAGATELVPPIDFPGGRMSSLQDPQGAAFGLMKFTGAPA